MADHLDNERTGAYAFEHTLAWLMALVAAGLAAIGALVAFGVLGGSEQGVDVTGASGPGAAGASDWMQGMLWLLPAISAALLSRALHITDHHRALAADEANGAMFNTEHGAAYIAALVTIGAAALSPLVGFDVFDRANIAQDGLIWGVVSVVPAILTGTLHAVGHHQHVAAATYVERRADLPSRGRTVAR